MRTLCPLLLLLAALALVPPARAAVTWHTARNGTVYPTYSGSDYTEEVRQYDIAHSERWHMGRHAMFRLLAGHLDERIPPRWYNAEVALANARRAPAVLPVEYLAPAPWHPAPPPPLGPLVLRVLLVLALVAAVCVLLAVAISRRLRYA